MNALPWDFLIDEERDGAWAGLAAWEAWLSQQMPPDTADAFMDAEDGECWKENLYAITAKAIREAKP